MNNHHFLLISYPAQGHLNPLLQLAKQLTRAGARVTFATTVHGLTRLNTTLPNLHPTFSYASFSDGNDDGTRPSKDLGTTMAELKCAGSPSLRDLLNKLSDDGRPVSFLIYSVLLPWAATVARDLHVASIFFSSQSATTFAIYHRYFNTCDGLYNNNGDSTNDNSISIKLPGLPLLTSSDIPSFLVPKDRGSSIIPTFQEHIQTLEQDPNPIVLVNTFDALEEGSITAVDNIKVIAIGPLIPSAYSDKKDPSDTSFGGDLFEKSTDYLPWLDSKRHRSVIYISFGSLAVVKKTQMEEILKGLVESGRPFLVVNRSSEDEVEEEMKGIIGKSGLLVRWCSQVEVLSHRSTGCFLTHCGWNSTMESMVAGVPVLGFPQFSDQLTNIRMVEDLWGNGVRVKVNEEGVVEREEIKRCLDIVMGDGERGEEIRRNVLKWKGLAMEAVKEGGSSLYNMKQFFEILG